jgi:YD repeat-containing protein
MFPMKRDEFFQNVAAFPRGGVSKDLWARDQVERDPDSAYAFTYDTAGRVLTTSNADTRSMG